MFTDEQVAYLNTLPAVAHATRARIIYTRAFKMNCLYRNSLGESPTVIFRKSGLPPELIGSKRIERCMARWRTDQTLTDIMKSRHRHPPVMTEKDRRDLLIRDQAKRIVDLEREVERLRDQLQKCRDDK